MPLRGGQVPAWQGGSTAPRFLVLWGGGASVSFLRTKSQTVPETVGWPNSVLTELLDSF